MVWLKKKILRIIYSALKKQLFNNVLGFWKRRKKQKDLEWLQEVPKINNFVKIHRIQWFNL